MKNLNFASIFFVLLLLSSCKSLLDSDNPKSSDEMIKENLEPEKKQLEVRFSCGEEGISDYINDGWIVINKYSEEKVCTWKSFPATRSCDIEKDKGCKITKPDKIGEETIYLLEK